VAAALDALEIDNLLVLERGEIGESFRRWPKQMRFITPSFDSMAYGSVDLNSIHPLTSPAHMLGVEHPSGAAYAGYLARFAAMGELKVQTGVDVQSVESAKRGGFALRTSRGVYRAKHVVWAAGEFQYPKRNGFEGADLCVHNGAVRDWGNWVPARPRSVTARSSLLPKPSIVHVL